ncbi:MAG: hypothetical protein IK014_01605 [Lachnospiraceae bacterium]|nr:hypothetical protein [Lachnospiraceae bacterium]
MKEWKKPVLDEINVKDTACNYWVDTNDESYVENDIDLGTCHNPYWEGNGMSLEDAIENNPFYQGGWGQQ